MNFEVSGNENHNKFVWISKSKLLDFIEFTKKKTHLIKSPLSALQITIKTRLKQFTFYPTTNILRQLTWRAKVIRTITRVCNAKLTQKCLQGIGGPRSTNAMKLWVNVTSNCSELISLNIWSSLSPYN